MSAQVAKGEAVARTKWTLMWFLSLATAVAVFVFFTTSWLDSHKTPTIVFHATPDARVAVDIRGAISTPGVVYVAPGDRLIDVVMASGGFAPDADQSLINLSSRVSDGQMIVIPTQAPASALSNATGLLNINTASVDELKQLPGIGDVLAQRIVTYRELNGPFTSIDELSRIDGISPALVDDIRPYTTVSDGE